MAKNDKKNGSPQDDADENDEETALTTKATPQGAILPDEWSSYFDKLGGFASIETVLIGAPSDDKIPMYMGLLLGPGQDIEMADTKKPDGSPATLPTWSFHPMGKNGNGDVGPVRNVTHIVPAPTSMHAAVARIWDVCQREKKEAIIGLIFLGKGVNRKGQPLNKYRVFERYSPRG